MRTLIIIFRLATMAFLVPFMGYAQGQSSYTTISLDNLQSFRDPGPNWEIVGDARANYLTPNDMQGVKGTGVLLNNYTKNNQMHLYTVEEFGDLELELDFMMARQSNSGIYFQGRYEVQLLDSWTQVKPGFSDAGAIYARWLPEKQETYEGTPPLVNVARAPGLWQHMSIRFRAPRFNEEGKKIANARFERVVLNGVVVQENTEVTGPTRASMYADEFTAGPLVFQGDHGPVAFKNLRYKTLTEKDTIAIPQISNWERYWETRDPIIVRPADGPEFIRAFINHGNKKLTHVIAVGDPTQVNYAYDLKQGALFQVWRGPFVDATRAWHDRGDFQLAVPLGSVISLSDAPPVAVLDTETAAWPDSVAFDDLKNKGYLLDRQRSPTFRYIIKGVEVSDKILISPKGEGITRTISVNHAPENLFCRIAAGNQIKDLGEGAYAVDDKSYYIKIDGKFRPVIRESGGGQELIVKYATSGVVEYDMVW